jgi:leucyl aminopeptidase
MAGGVRVNPTKVRSDPRRLLDTEASVIALPMWPGDGDAATARLGAESTVVASELDLDLTEATVRDNAKGKPGEIVSIPVFGNGRGAASADGEADIEQVVLVGIGDGSAAAYRKAGAALARATRGRGRVATSIVSSEPSPGDGALRGFIEGAVLATYTMTDFRSKPLGKRKRPLDELVLAETDDRDEAIAAGAATANAVWFARDLIHTPSNVKDPAWLAKRAVEMGKSARLSVRVRDERALGAEGFGGILAVGSGSDRPPRLIAVRYEPDNVPDAPHVVLVGKGITFDSGGLSLKPRTAMVNMKTDMSGGAVVLGVLSALRDLNVSVKVTGLVPAAENLPGAAAQRPSDVIKQYDGTTVEVLNTDAEGRLVLADALGYAAAELDPSVIVDVATLTGAATVALGRTHAAMYANSDSLAEALSEAGEAAGEPLWRMPLVDEYEETLDSDVANVAHISTMKGTGGSITAALFLRRFVGGLPWAHFDIAGPGRADKDKDDVVKGGTAFSTRALLYWLEAGAPGVAAG